MPSARRGGAAGSDGRGSRRPSSISTAASILRPTLAPVDAPQLSLAAALALARTLEPLAPGRVAIKWPNDCLLDGRKVAGILTEMDAELDRVRAVVLGIGVNLNAGARAFAPELRPIATSVRLATGRKVDRVAFTAALCEALEAVYDRLLLEGFGALIAEWNRYSCLSGREVTVDCAGQRTTGRVRGLDARGRLILVAADGRQVPIVAGDVTVVGGYGRGETRGAPRRSGGAR